MTARITLLAMIGLAVCAFAACGPSPMKRKLEVTATRYDTTNLTECGGQVRNISPDAIIDLQVQVEFQNADGNRVRTATGPVSPATLAPGQLGAFSVPYLKGSNDPPVVRCRAIEFRSHDVLVAHEDDTTPLP